MKNIRQCVVMVGIALLSTGCAMEMGETEEEVSSTVAAINNGAVHYSRALLRIDRPSSNPAGFQQQCSAFLIAPNMIATAAHCVDGLTSAGASGNRDGMRWRHVQVRLVYKPTSTEVMCINESCRNADNSPRFTTVRAWWDSSYSGTGTGSDFAIITRIQGLDFPTRSADWGGATPSALSSSQGDFLRILDGRAPGSTELNIHGYGAFNDTQGDSSPRIGWLTLDWWGSKHVFSTAGRDSRVCSGDSGGPLTYRDGVFGSTYAIGSFSNTDSRVGDCPESGDRMRWTRLDPKRSKIHVVMDWANRPGSPFCRRWARSSLPGDGGYYRCW